MAARPTDPAESARRKAAVEAALRDGFAPFGQTPQGGRGSAVGEAARRLNCDSGTVSAWVRSQERFARQGRPHALPDWSLWSLHRCEHPVERAAPSPEPVALTPKPVAEKPVYRVPARSRAPVPRRYILTSAQNDTPVNGEVWRNLLALAAHYSAEVLVGRFIYNLNAQGQAGQEKDTAASRTRSPSREDRWWAPEILPYVRDERVSLAPDLEWCGHINILPTATNPLSDLHNYTGTRSAVFPHPKVALESVATGRLEPTKINYTTGAVTERNYIQRKAGQKAEFHHTFGALLVEVAADGAWWTRQLNADSRGTICDLTLRVDRGVVTDRHSVEAITWGDIHEQTLEPWMRAACWAPGGVLDVLRPRFQVVHDVLDFRSRNHHDAKDPHVNFLKWSAGVDDVRQELIGSRDFLASLSYRPWCQTVVVDSNHDNALTRWLREADYRLDPRNARLFLRLQSRVYDALAESDGGFHLLEWALRDLGLAAPVRFLRRDESFLTCDEDGNGIENSAHGDIGPNGSRGSPPVFVKMGRRMNIGHGHSAFIREGVYAAGMQGSLDQPYARGPSSWSASFIVTYANGKRAICTFRDERWRGIDEIRAERSVA